MTARTVPVSLTASEIRHLLDLVLEDDDDGQRQKARTDRLVKKLLKAGKQPKQGGGA